VYQLVQPDLPSDFPPLKSLDALPTNLTQQLTHFVGREREFEVVKRLLDHTRLLTLTGTGGVGKTRLALQVGADLLDECPDGVWLVELAGLSDSALVPQQIAAALSMREEPYRPLVETLVDRVRHRRLLLVLDNCEHLIQGTAALADTLLRRCPELRILATSREALGIAGETVWRVPSLAVPAPEARDSVERLTQYEAVRLFIDRAQQHKPGFAITAATAPAVAQVCHRLDGMPLAIELAAARVRSLSMEELMERLDDRFRLLTGGSRTALPRQQTLRATLDWSYDLLSEPERVLLQRLAVFAGGWTLDAAEAVVAGQPVEPGEVIDLLGALVEKSLVVYEDAEGPGRYRLLETVRQYSRDRLSETRMADAAQERHRDYFLELAETAQLQLRGPEQAVWLERLAAEHENLRAGLDWSSQKIQGHAESPAEADRLLRLAGALSGYWEMRGHLTEGRERLNFALAAAGPTAGIATRAAALNGAGLLAEDQGDNQAARSMFEEALALWKELGNERRVAGALNNIGIVAWVQGDYATAHSLYEEALLINRKLGNRRWEATNLANLGLLAEARGDYAAARQFGEESLAIRRTSHDTQGILESLIVLGCIFQTQGDYAACHPLFDQALGISRELGNPRWEAISLGNLGAVARCQGDAATARALQEKSLAIRREIGDRWGMAASLSDLGNVAADQGDYPLAASLYEEALGINRELGNRDWEAAVLANLGSLLCCRGNHSAARCRYRESLALARELADRLQVAECLEGFGQLAAAQQQHERAAQLGGAADALRESLGAPLPPSERDRLERAINPVRVALGQAGFAAAWAVGRAMALEQAIAAALEETGDA
jgi:predicted ATPase/Tfp pilus assembly protein PilF